jgi:hypothetical protein
VIVRLMSNRELQRFDVLQDLNRRRFPRLPKQFSIDLNMTSPDVRATSRAYVAGLERHKMEEWRTNAASGPRLGASSMTKRLYSSLDERWGSSHSQLHSQASLPAYFLAGRGIGVTPTCSSAVYGAP